MITFVEHQSPKWSPRTWQNASADATIAFAFDFNTKGEKLTKFAAETQGNVYVPVDMKILTSGKFGDLIYKAVQDKLYPSEPITINIAGNQIATCIKYGANQEICDRLVLNFLKHIFLSKQVLNIYTGGQSGFDESGLKAAVRLGIPATCVCPKGWKYINEKGWIVADEKLFKKRFENVTREVY